MKKQVIHCLAALATLSLASCGGESPGTSRVANQRVPSEASTTFKASPDVWQAWVWSFSCNAAWNRRCEQNETLNFTEIRPQYHLCKYELEVIAADPRPDWSTIDSHGSPSDRYIAVTGGLALRDGVPIRNELTVRTKTAGSGNFFDRWGANYDFKVKYTIVHRSVSAEHRRRFGCIAPQIIAVPTPTPTNPETTSACACVNGSRAEAQTVKSCLSTNGRCDLLPGVRHLQCVRPNTCLDAMAGGRCPFDFPNTGYQPPIEVTNSPYCT